jgi:hypothetical protein
VILLPPITIVEEFRELRIDDTKTTHFHAVIPLHSDEMELKLKRGAEALFDRFDQHGVSEILDPGRRSVVKGRRSWLPFKRGG